MNYIVCLLLCFLPEEEAFWTLCSIVEDMRLPGFYSKKRGSNMVGFSQECAALGILISRRLPELMKLLGEDDTALMVQLFALKTLHPLFVNQMSFGLTAVIWEGFFTRGGELSLIRICLSLFAVVSDKLHFNIAEATVNAQEESQFQALEHLDISGFDAYSSLLDLMGKIDPEELLAEVSRERCQLTAVEFQATLATVQVENARAMVGQPALCYNPDHPKNPSKPSDDKPLEDDAVKPNEPEKEEEKEKEGEKDEHDENDENDEKDEKDEKEREKEAEIQKQAQISRETQENMYEELAQVSRNIYIYISICI